jgi:sodium pump decarboxylase gamma subunit
MDLFRQAVIIMCLGMGFAFAFLYMVILAVRITGLLVGRCEAKQAPAAAGVEARGDAVAAVIASAVIEHDAGQRGQG